MVTRRALRRPAIATTGSEIAVRPRFWNVRHIAGLGAGILAVAAAVVAAVVIAGSSDSAAVGGADLSWEAAAAIRYPGLTPAQAAEAARWTALAGEATAAGVAGSAGALTAGQVAEAGRLRALKLADSINRLPFGGAAGGVAVSAGALTAGEVAEAGRLRVLKLADSINRLPFGGAAGGVAVSELPGVLHAGGDR